MSGDKILLIEDNALNRELATDALEMANYVVIQATNAEEGIVLARTERPALVLIDIALPGMDGLSAMRLLKQTETTKHIPVVALTAYAMRGDAEKALAAGCDGYLTKPIDVETFPKEVARFIRA